jgi:hypothetical protein
MPFPNERIERKYQFLEQLDPKHEVDLEGTFTNHLADAIRASSPGERQQALDKAIEAYEHALEGFASTEFSEVRKESFKDSPFE